MYFGIVLLVFFILFVKLSSSFFLTVFFSTGHPHPENSEWTYHVAKIPELCAIQPVQEHERKLCKLRFCLLHNELKDALYGHVIHRLVIVLYP